MLSRNFVENVDLLSETLIPIESAGKSFPIPVTRPTLERWCRKGVCKGENRVRLETVTIGARRFLSEEGILRFLRAQNNSDAAQQPAIPKPTMSRAEIAAGRKRFGLPTPTDN